MGANLYIWGDEPQGNDYFRDSYNPTSIMWNLGLSWHSHVIPMLDEDELLQPDKGAVLLEMVKSAKPLPMDKYFKMLETDTEGERGVMARIAKMLETDPPPDFEGANLFSKEKILMLETGAQDPEKWEQYFEDKYIRFINFLETAIELNKPIVVSL
jgi:hypothetical protein